MIRQKVLITGGTGYLGGCIGAALALNEYDVSLGSRYPYRYGSIEGCSQIKTDWDDSELSFTDGFDVIIHAAGMNASECAKDPDLALVFNGKVTRRLAEKSAICGVKKLFYLSTMHVYKGPLIGSFSEESPTLNTHPYATSKVHGELAVIETLTKSALEGSVLRLSNCFGAPIAQSDECWGLVVNQFVREAYDKGTITINGNYLSKRDFMPITGLNHILLQILGYRGRLANIINVSSGRVCTLEEIAITVSDLASRYIGTDISVIKNSKPIYESALSFKNNALRKMGLCVNYDLSREVLNLCKYLSVGN